MSKSDILNFLNFTEGNERIVLLRKPKRKRLNKNSVSLVSLHNNFMMGLEGRKNYEKFNCEKNKVCINNANRTRSTSINSPKRSNFVVLEIKETKGKNNILEHFKYNKNNRKPVQIKKFKRKNMCYFRSNRIQDEIEQNSYNDDNILPYYNEYSMYNSEFYQATIPDFSISNINIEQSPFNLEPHYNYEVNLSQSNMTLVNSNILNNINHLVPKYNKLYRLKNPLQKPDL